MPVFHHDGIDFNYRQAGEGVPFFFQHGLGGNVEQPFGLFMPPKGVRLIAFDCRGHGQTRPLGDPARIGMSFSADDLLALMDYLRIERAVVGGISMGAAIALDFGLRYRDRAIGLVLSRVAWLPGSQPRAADVFLLIARLIREHGARRGQEIFRTTPGFAETARLSVDVAGSLLRQFENPRIEEVVVILERIPTEMPRGTLADLAGIAAPTLVLANRQDPVHPFEYGEAVAKAIPGAEFRELTPKSVDRDQHAVDVQRWLTQFFEAHFLSQARPV